MWDFYSRILGWKHFFVVNLYQKCCGARLISEKLLLIIAEMHHSRDIAIQSRGLLYGPSSMQMTLWGNIHMEPAISPKGRVYHILLISILSILSSC